MQNEAKQINAKQALAYEGFPLARAKQNKLTQSKP